MKERGLLSPSAAFSSKSVWGHRAAKCKLKVNTQSELEGKRRRDVEKRGGDERR